MVPAKVGAPAIGEEVGPDGLEEGVAMQALVTGCAGFIGSRLTETLLAQGVAMRGIDAFTAYYDPAIKHRTSVLPSSPTFLTRATARPGWRPPSGP